MEVGDAGGESDGNKGSKFWVRVAASVDGSGRRVITAVVPEPRVVVVATSSPSSSSLSLSCSKTRFSSIKMDLETDCNRREAAVADDADDDRGDAATDDDEEDPTGCEG